MENFVILIDVILVFNINMVLNVNVMFCLISDYDFVYV